MGFLSGGVAFQRFRCAGPKPNLLDQGEKYVERLRDRRADQHRAPGADGTSVGWAAGASVLDTDFRLDKQVYVDHLVFDFWTQAARLPADRLKAYFTADLAALAKDNPSGFASARQKREAKASARERLLQEARDGRYRKWKATPCLWDGVTNAVLFGATSCTAAARFSDLFEQTFDASLVDPDKLGGKLTAVTAATLAEAYSAAAANETLTNFWGWKDATESPAWCPLQGAPQFLGNEFLLWLWYYADRVSDTVKLADGTEATYMFAGGLEVEDPRGASGRGTMNSLSAVKLPEAKAAVRSGKLPRKAALTVVRQGDQFTFVLQAETFAVSSVKVAAPDEKTPRERELARLSSVRDLCEGLDLLYRAFLARRLTGYWEGETKDVRAWLTETRTNRAAA
jgi:hypothetical protein